MIIALVEMKSELPINKNFTVETQRIQIKKLRELWCAR